MILFFIFLVSSISLYFLFVKLSKNQMIVLLKETESVKTRWGIGSIFQETLL